MGASFIYNSIKELLLEVFKENDRAKAFYEKFGFKLTGQKKINDIDVLCMSKVI